MASPKLPNVTEKRFYSKLRLSEIVSILPCLFNLPIKKLQKIINTSHGTLSKARRAHGLDRWPYESILQGRFKMTWDDVDDLQLKTMASASERIADFVNLVHKESREHTRKPFTLAEPEPKAPEVDSKANAVMSTENAEPEDGMCREGEDPGDYYLRMALREDPVQTRWQDDDADRDSYWKGLYDLFDSDRFPEEPASPSLLGC